MSWCEVPTASAFIQLRAKLLPEAFWLPMYWEGLILHGKRLDAYPKLDYDYEKSVIRKIYAEPEEVFGETETGKWSEEK